MFNHTYRTKTCFFLSCVLLLLTLSANSTPLATKGVLDLRGVDLNINRQALAGDWYFFNQQLVTSDEIINSGNGFTSFPQTWNAANSGNGSGYATYALFIITNGNVKSLALEIPQVYSSYTVWVNNLIVAKNGTPGKTEALTIPQWMPQTVSFENPGDTLKLVIQIANFHHYNGGLKDPIYLGASELLQGHRSMSITGNLFESFSLGIIGMAFLIVFFSMKKKAITLFFALLCITWAIRVGFSNLYLFISYVPDFNWYAMIRIEYITLFLTMIWAIQFLGGAFPKEETRVVRYLFVALNMFFILYTALTAPPQFTSWITIYLSCCALLLLYGVVLVLRAWINQRTGSTYLSISFLLALMIFGYDVFAYEGIFIYNPIILSVGYTTIFLLMGITLLMHLNFIKTKKPSLSTLTYQDLYNNKEV
jgi:7TM diverse intracellular signalling